MTHHCFASSTIMGYQAAAASMVWSHFFKPKSSKSLDMSFVDLKMFSDKGLAACVVGVPYWFIHQRYLLLAFGFSWVLISDLAQEADTLISALNSSYYLERHGISDSLWTTLEQDISYMRRPELQCETWMQINVLLLNQQGNDHTVQSSVEPQRKPRRKEAGTCITDIWSWTLCACQTLRSHCSQRIKWKSISPDIVDPYILSSHHYTDWNQRNPKCAWNT